jgi:DNA-binding response OmpR family regulator
MWDSTTRLLLIDDDVRLTDAISRYLKRDGYKVDIANDGGTGLELFRAKSPDLVVLDVMMPGIDGWEVCRRIRESSHIPIIMLTARANETDRVLGLRMGADDYVDKPFSLKELVARIEAVLRRVHMAPPPSQGYLYDDGQLRLETEGMLAIRDGEALNLTATERRLLFTLAERAGRVLAPSQILEQVWGHEYEGQSDYVKLYIWRLRQKLEPDPGSPTYIQTERGLGYRFVPADEGS